MYENWWAPEISCYATAILRVLLFGFALIWIPIPEYIDNLYNITYWSPVGIFKIFNGPIISKDYLNIIFYSWRLLGFFSLIGLFYRITAPIAVICLIISTGYDYNFGHVYHSYHLIMLNLLFLAFTPANEALSLDNYVFKIKSRTAWYHGLSLRLQMFHIVYVLFINGYKKLEAGGIEWALSDNLLFHLMRIPGLRPSTWKIMTEAPDFIILSACIVLFIQITSPITLIKEKLSIFYLPFWMSFHVGVTWLIGGHMSFWTQIPCYLVFIIFLYFKDKSKSILSPTEYQLG